MTNTDKIFRKLDQIAEAQKDTKMSYSYLMSIFNSIHKLSALSETMTEEEFDYYLSSIK